MLRRCAIVVAVAALAIVPFFLTQSAQASISWSASSFRSVATATTGTETSAPANASDGLDLVELGGFSVFVKASTGTFTAGYLRCWAQNPATGDWMRCPDSDLTVTAGLAAQAFPQMRVTSPVGRVAFVPDTLGVANVVTLVGTRVQ